ncbi:MAG: hypothetical protein Q4G64_06335, partial [bacterium]|nr:hypothetical protein [bacterium]
MSENENTRREQDAPQDEGVALSPYDSDLRSPEGEPETGEFELPTPAGYDEPESTEFEQAMRGEQGPDEPRFQAPEWASFREPVQPEADPELHADPQPEP